MKQLWTGESGQREETNSGKQQLCMGKRFGNGFAVIFVTRSFLWKGIILQIIAIHPVMLHKLEWMQISTVKTEEANFVKNKICAILKTSGHNCVRIRQIHKEQNEHHKK